MSTLVQTIHSMNYQYRNTYFDILKARKIRDEEEKKFRLYKSKKESYIKWHSICVKLGAGRNMLSRLEDDIRKQKLFCWLQSISYKNAVNDVERLEQQGETILQELDRITDRLIQISH